MKKQQIKKTLLKEVEKILLSMFQSNQKIVLNKFKEMSNTIAFSYIYSYDSCRFIISPPYCTISTIEVMQKAIEIHFFLSYKDMEQFIKCYSNE